MILVTGARGVVGTPLCKALGEAGEHFVAVSRSHDHRGGDHQTLKWDLSQTPDSSPGLSNDTLGGLHSLIHCAPIWLLPAHLDQLERCGLEQLVVFSSTSVLSKRGSANPEEQALVDQLKTSEDVITQFCQQHEIDLTILRPSLIYGYGRDQNVTHIAGFIKRYRFMLLVGKATGLRQPVHADDLVKATISSLSKPVRRQVAYNLAGKDVLSYRQMVERIFNGLGHRAIIIAVPLVVFRFALICAAKLGRFSYTPEMANRMNQDLNYDYSAAAGDLGFEPQGFLENPARDLP